MDIRATKFASLVNVANYPTYKSIVDSLLPPITDATGIARQLGYLQASAQYGLKPRTL